MRLVTILVLIAAITLCGGCRRAGFHENRSVTNSSISKSQAPAELAATVTAPRQAPQASYAKADSSRIQGQQLPAESLSAASSSQASSQAIERKIIRNAELTIELDSPEEAQRRIAAIAEKHGGFVVTSESRQNEGDQQAAPRTSVNVIARVPAARFADAVEEIQQVGGHVLHRKITGQDVTEEFIDLEARLRAKRALESQFLEIMKRAQKVSDALEVQTQLAEVRGEIERLEGRRRFLENQAALSTITVTLQTPAPIIAATTGGFWHSIKLAFGDGLDTAAEIVLGIIRFVIVMIPVVALILLPLWFAVRWLRKRVEWLKRTPAAVNVSE
jgi:SOS-response transcriptional repressor LexA